MKEARVLSGPSTHHERLRHAELGLVQNWFEPTAHVLDLGAGAGYQASLISEMGCDVTAVDVAVRGRTYYPVREYDGKRIPLPDESVDVVFSSHVLEHVESLMPLLSETKRVMRPLGLAIHILPTPAWRLWTSLAHYPYVLKTLLLRQPADSLVNVGG